MQPLSPLENVARWPGTHGIATSSEAGPFQVSNLNDGTPEAWGSTAEPGRDVYAALVLRTPQAIQEYRIELFSPDRPPRPHLRDIRVIAADAEGAEGPKWRVVRSRISENQPFSQKVTVPPLADRSMIRVELDRTDPNWGPHKIWGLGCFTASHGDARNYLPSGLGVYVRELQMGIGSAQNLVTTNATLPERLLDFLASSMDALAVSLVALLLLAPRLPRALLRNGRATQLFSLGQTLAPSKSYCVALLLGVLLTVGLLASVFQAFGTDKILHWDETYYANIAVMGAHGYGLYPAIQNMLPTHIMGGVGYLVYVYVFAVKAFGATIYSLRLVALAAMLIALVPIYLTVRLWYDSLTAAVAVAIAPSMYLYELSNTARMDSLTMAVTAWMLYFSAVALKKQRWSWHLVAGLVAGLALQAHIDTLAVTIACGLLYLVSSVPPGSQPKMWLRHLNPLAIFLLGFGISLAGYIVVNVMPDVQSFFRAMSYARPAVLQQGSISASGLVRSVLSPQTVLSKEIQRYQDLFDAVPRFESLLFCISLVALLTRRGQGGKNTLILLAGSIAGAALILYNSSPFYMIHLFPVLILPVAPFLTRGFSGHSVVTSKNIPWTSIAALMVTALALLPEPWTHVASRPRLFQRSTDAPEIVARVQHTASPACTIAGDRALYVPYFLNYPRFHSTVRTEEVLGSLYLGGRSFDQLWGALQPDVVFGSLDERIRPYIEHAHYKLIDADIWLKTQTPLTKGCMITSNP